MGETFDEFEQNNEILLDNLTHQERIHIYAMVNSDKENINEAITEVCNEKDLEYEY